MACDKYAAMWSMAIKERIEHCDDFARFVRLLQRDGRSGLAGRAFGAVRAQGATIGRGQGDVLRSLRQEGSLLDLRRKRVSGG